MKIIEGFRSAPGCCAVCGTSQSPGGVVDLDRPDRMNPARDYALMLCSTCALEAGTLAAGLAGKVIVDKARVDETVPLDDFLAAVDRANEAEAFKQRMREVLS